MDNDNIRGLDETLRRLQQAQDYFKGDVLRVVATEAVHHFKESFENEGFTDRQISKWASRKSKRLDGTNAQKILTKSSDLADSIDYRIQGDTVTIYSDKPYAEIHNEGGIIQVTEKMRKYFWAQYYKAVEMTGDKESDIALQFKAMALAKEIKIEKRQFMGVSAALEEKITNKIIRDLTRILTL